MPAIAASIKNCLASIDLRQKIWIAYSGGIDSSVLLHAAHSIASETGHVIQAVHIDHQIHRDSSQWSQNCIQYCQSVGIPIKTIRVNLDQHMQHGLEAAARIARYAAFADFLETKDVLLTAHHADDQVETLFLQLLRGAGPDGLSGCAPQKKLVDALLLRPLLQNTRQQIMAYAQQQQLVWQDDPSNQSLQANRNYLRHEVIPLLQKRWPNLHTTIGRSASWQQESSCMLDELAKIDLSSEDLSSFQLSLDCIMQLEYARKKNALRYWIKQHRYAIPSAQVLEQIIHAVVHAREDAEPCVAWGEHELRKYRRQLYLLSKLPEHDPQQVFDWSVQEPLRLSHIKIILTHEALASFGLLCEPNEILQVRFRQGGEVIRPLGRGCEKTLKSLFQEAAVPPWLRDRIPLLYRNGRLICVWGFWLAEECN